MGELKDTWFQAYLKGNLVMPQTFDAGALFLAHMALEADDLATLETATRLSPSQLIHIRRAMESAHRVRRIPAGSTAYLERARAQGRYDMSRTIVIDDEKLHYIWNRFREHAVALAKALAGRPDGLLLARQWTAAFKTRECQALLRRFRAEYDRRRDGSDQAAAMLRSRITRCVDRGVAIEHRGLLQKLITIDQESDA